MSATRDHNQDLLTLVQTSLTDIESETSPFTPCLQRTIRIARRRGDYTDLFWLEHEMLNYRDKKAMERLLTETARNFAPDDLEVLRYKTVDHYMSARGFSSSNRSQTGDGEIIAHSVPELEAVIQRLRRDIADARNAGVPRSVQHNLPDRFSVDEAEFTLHQLETILAGIKHRVYGYLSNVEQQLIYSEINHDIFRRYQHFVDTRLSEIAPSILEELSRAYQQANANDSAAYAQAAVSCRRVIKALADIVYPPRKDEVIGSDGKSRKLTDAKYVSRLIQYIWETSLESRSKEVLMSQVDEARRRIERLDDLANKGLHEQVTRDEVDQCVIQTYLLIGDVLRIRDGVPVVTHG